MDTIRKWLNKPKADDKSLLARFYHADRALTAIASELDSFDGRAEPERCSRLVGRLRQGQDRVLAITSQIMDELLSEDRAPRAFRAKFPEEVLQDSLAGQLWFGAECLAAGSSIMNRENESAAMRPLAKAVTKSLDTVRNLLRDQCYRNNIPNSLTLSLDVNDAATENLYESLKIFDKLFAEFELLYVSAMVQVKSKQEHETQELICVLFSETLQRALKINLLEQDQVDAFDPSLMFSIPRLAIIVGLVIYDKGPLNMDLSAESMSEMFRPFRSLLIKIRTLLRSLNKIELHQLEKLLCTNEDIHLKNKLNCDEDSKINSDDELVSEMISDCVANKDNISNFYSVNEEPLPNGNDWEEDREVKDNLVIPDCASGYLIPNTNFGHLFLASDAPLTDSFISNEDEYNSINPQTIPDENSAVIVKDGDSGIGTGNTSLDRTPESESGQIATPVSTIPESNDTKDVLTGRYTKNWESLEQERQPAASCSSKIQPSDSSDESESTVCDIAPGTSQISNITTKIKISNEIQKQSSKKSSKTVSRKLKSKNDSSSSSSTSSTSSSSSGDTLSTQSDGDRQEVALAYRAAGRMKYKTTENLLHRLFVCIAGVADQLQTNFASDLRQILKSVFLMNTTPTQEEISVSDKSKDGDLFEFRASENDVIQENNGGSNQSIYSAEEVNPESDSVFAENRGERSSSLETEITVSPAVISTTERSRSLGESDSPITTSSSTRQYSENKRTYSERATRTSSICNNSTNHNNKNQTISRSNESSPINHSSAATNNNNNNNSNNNSNNNTTSVATHECIIQPQTLQTESPPRWIPDEEAPRCMACFSQFTAFRRRHHCRNCGGVFCGVCSSTTAPLPRYGLTKAVRVCRSCYLREVGT